MASSNPKSKPKTKQPHNESPSVSANFAKSSTSASSSIIDYDHESYLQLTTTGSGTKSSAAKTPNQVYREMGRTKNKDKGPVKKVNFVRNGQNILLHVRWIRRFWNLGEIQVRLTLNVPKFSGRRIGCSSRWSISSEYMKYRKWNDDMDRVLEIYI